MSRAFTPNRASLPNLVASAPSIMLTTILERLDGYDLRKPEDALHYTAIEAPAPADALLTLTIFRK